MARRKRRKEQKKARPGRPSGALRRVYSRADELIQAGQYAEALEYLESYRDRHPRNAFLLHYLALAEMGVGRVWPGVADMERAVELGPRFSPSLLFPLALMYQEAGLYVHAIRALRRYLQEHPHDMMVSVAREMLANLDAQSQAGAEERDITPEELEEGSYWLERCRRALDEGRWADAEQDAVRAAQAIPGWTPPRNNRALALYFMGRPREAVQAARDVLETDPGNVHTLANLVRFYVALDEREAAEEALDRLRALRPEDVQRAEGPYRKLAEAFAFMDAHQEVYDALHRALEAGEPLGDTGLYMLGAVAANLGQAQEARRRWREVLKANPGFTLLQEYLDLVEQGRPGPGLASRYPYFAPVELIPADAMEEFIAWIGQLDDMDEEQRRREAEGWYQRFPAVHDLARRLIWEDDEAGTGIMVLQALGTPRAARELQRFAEGQAGPDDDRLRAASALAEMGVYDPDTSVRLWQHGRRREVYIRGWIVVDEPDTEYAPEVADMVNRAIVLGQEGKLDEARALYERALKRAPNVKEAWGNLGALAIQAGEDEAGEAYLHRALEVDPLYAFPRCNLAMQRIAQGKLDEARDLLLPLSTRTRFLRHEVIYYMRVLAHLAIAEKEYDAARHSLQYILELDPDDEAAKKELDYLGLLSLSDRFAEFAAGMRERDFQRRRRRWAKTILTPDATLTEGLAPLTKDGLVGMAHALGCGSVSAKRKTEAFDHIVDWLSDPDAISWLQPDLTAEDRAALRYVLDAGGRVPWDEFSQHYDDDRDESPYWNWHRPETTMGRLRVRGLLVEGTVDGEVAILMPRELREPLARLLAEKPGSA